MKDKLTMPNNGQLYIFDTGDIGSEWLVVRSHPDDPSIFLLVPVDDFSLVGTPDLVLPQEIVGRPLVVRCGESDWFPAKICESHLLVGTVPEEMLKLVRQQLADLSRLGTVPTCQRLTNRIDTDLDPEYEEWITEVARARNQLLAKAEN
jgi:hypothetical protein